MLTTSDRDLRLTNSANIKPLAVCTLVSFILFGLWLSFHYSRTAWDPDPDIYVTMATWREYQTHGISAFASWAYTKDNWIFSLIPITTVMFELTGPNIYAALILGWAFFVTSVALSAWIVSRVSDWITASIVASALLYANFLASWSVGYLTYPISHDISMTWGLAAISIALAGLNRNSLGLCCLAALLIFLDAVSDPWAGAAIAMPVILVSATLAFLRRDQRRVLIGLAVSVLVASILAKTRVFKLLGFLPPSHFQFADMAGVVANIRWGTIGLAGIFNIIPGASNESSVVQIVDVLALVSVTGLMAYLAIKTWRRDDLAIQFVSAVTISSTVIVAGLFLFGKWDPGAMAGRFFANLYFLGGILLACLASGRRISTPVWAKLTFIAYAGLFVLSGIMSRPASWLDREPLPDRTASAKSFGAYLASQGLTYGYGSFWGTEAVSMAFLTKGSVTIRPVTFHDGMVRQRLSALSHNWFQPDAEPANQKVFVIVKTDGEECPLPKICEAIAIRQFGKPIRRLQRENTTILVWDHPLVTRIATSL